MKNKFDKMGRHVADKDLGRAHKIICVKKISFEPFWQKNLHTQKQTTISYYLILADWHKNHVEKTR